jgi:hypothetical protein
MFKIKKILCEQCLLRLHLQRAYHETTSPFKSPSPRISLRLHCTECKGGGDQFRWPKAT